MQDFINQLQLNLVLDISLIFFGALLLATIFLYIKQPIIIAYIVLGMIIGPLGFKLIQDIHIIEQISDLGIIFLMFLLGINLHPQKLLELLKITLPIVLLSSLIYWAIILGIVMLFGFSFAHSMIVALSLVFSSTIIGIKLIPTSTLHQKHEGDLIISVLLLQDIIAIFMLLYLYGLQADFLVGLESHFGITMQTGFFSVLVIVLLLVMLVATAFLGIKFIILPIIKKFSVIQDYMFLVSLGWCFTIAQAAEWLGLSYEIGAFIAGFALASHPISLVISEGLKPLREFFLILFFFAIGAGVNLQNINTIVIPALVIGVVVVACKYFVFRGAYHLAKEPSKISKSIGWRLAQASEFSILVAYAAQKVQKIDSHTALLIHLITIISMILSTYCVVGFCVTPISSNKNMRQD